MSQNKETTLRGTFAAEEKTGFDNKTGTRSGIIQAWARENYEMLILAAPAILLVVGLFILPLFNILYLSITEPEFGLQNYRLILEDEGIQRVLLRTLRLALITSVAAICAGYLVAYVLAAAGPKHRNAMLFFILVPFWVSALARAFSWILLLGRTGPVNSALLDANLVSQPVNILYNEVGVTIGMIHYMIPYAILPLYSTMKDIDLQLLSASRGLGASPLKSFWFVYLPLTMPGIKAAFGLVFVYCLGFYVIPVIIGGGRVLMVAQYISMTVLETVQWGVASMLSVTLLVSIFLMGAASRQVRGKGAAGAAS